MEWIKRRLGAPELKVPLDDSKLSDAISEAKHWFVAKKGIEKDLTLDLYAGQVEYNMPLDCDAVIDVAFQVSPLDISLIFTPNIMADERVPYSPFAAPSTGGLYSSFVQALQYIETGKRILGAEQNWIYYPYKKKLLIIPDQKGGKAIVEYKSSTVTSIELLPERDHDLIKRFALAWARRDLGSIYSRYSTWPTAQGQQPLNGPQLLAEAEKEFETLTNEIAASAMPMPWLMG